MAKCERIIEDFFQHLIKGLSESQPINFNEFAYELRKKDTNSNDKISHFIMGFVDDQVLK